MLIGNNMYTPKRVNSYIFDISILNDRRVGESYQIYREYGEVQSRVTEELTSVNSNSQRKMTISSMSPQEDEER